MLLVWIRFSTVNPEDAARLERLGVARSYQDFKGATRRVPDETLEKLLELMDAEREIDVGAVRVIRQGDTAPVADATELHTEDGGVVSLGGTLPPDVPLGYHELVDLTDGTSTLLIVSPGSCYLPDDLFTWGWATQLYALRSEASWGHGDLGDLRQLGRFTRYLGGGMTLINPLHAVNPVTPLESSPYYPSSRWFRNPLYVRIEDVPGAGDLPELSELAAAGRAFNDKPRLDRDEIFDLKMRALALLWERFPGDERFDGYLEEQGDAHAGLATFMALSEVHRDAWQRWPEDVRTPFGAGVERFKRENHGRVRFHQWLQWLLDRQLAAASVEVSVVHDLAIGVDPKGADAWLWQDVFATGTTIGAPADDYAPDGQGWGVLAFDPSRLKAARYEPFIQTVRSSLRHAGGMRFDHVMGLWRLFWVPDGTAPSDGAYVRYPSSELLDILALESHRAGSFVIGEDLGTVEPVVRDEMAERNMLSYKVLWFEDGPPSTYPRLSLATPNNHDLPTTAGLWTDKDSDLQREMGLEPNESFMSATREKLASVLDVTSTATTTEVVDRSYDLLASAGSAIVTASLEDALEVVERYNQPGTSGEWNWSAALPLSLDEIELHPRPREIADKLSRRVAPEEPD
jgi:4-alpha-glucanotransferase